MNFFKNLKDMFSAKRLETGVSLFQENKPQYPTDNFVDNALGGYGKNELVYAAIQEITSSLAEAPIQAVNKDGEVIDNYPALRLINSPNKHMSGYEFWEITLQHMYLSGNAYWFKTKTKRGKVLEMWPLRPDRIRVVPDRENFISHYIYQLDGENYPVKASDIIHFKFCNPTNDLIGMSPLRPALRQISTDNEATDYAKVLLQNGGVPSGLLKIPEPLSREAKRRIKEQWRQSYGGNERGTIAVIDGDIEFSALNMNMQDMAFADLRAISETRILMVLGVPPILIGAKAGLDKSTYANYKEARASFWEETICSLQRRLTAKIDADKDLNPDMLTFKFDMSNVAAMADRRQQRFNNAVTGYQSGLLTLTEARAEIGLKELEMPAEEQPQEEPMQEEEDAEEQTKSRPGPSTKSAEDELRLLRQSLGRLSIADKFYDRFEHWAKKEFKMQGKQLRSLLEEFLTTGQKNIEGEALSNTNIEVISAKLAELEPIWMEHAKESSSPIMKKLMESAAEDALVKLNVSFDVSNAEVVEFINKHQYKFAESVATTSAKQVRRLIARSVEEGLTVGELTKQLKEEFAGTGAEKRAGLIARTETIRAANEGARTAYKSAGVTKMRWIASGDACPYCEGLDQKIVSVEENFLSKDDEYQPEGATRPLNLEYGDIQSPPVHPGCRCTIVPEVDE